MLMIWIDMDISNFKNHRSLFHAVHARECVVSCCCVVVLRPR